MNHCHHLQHYLRQHFRVAQCASTRYIANGPNAFRFFAQTLRRRRLACACRSADTQVIKIVGLRRFSLYPSLHRPIIFDSSVERQFYRIASSLCVDGSVYRFISILSIVRFLLSLSSFSDFFVPRWQGSLSAGNIYFSAEFARFLPTSRSHNTDSDEPAWSTTRVEHYSGPLPAVRPRVRAVLYIVAVIYVPWLALLITISTGECLGPRNGNGNANAKPGRNERKGFLRVITRQCVLWPARSQT